MTLTLREKTIIDMTLLMRVTHHMKTPDKQRMKMHIKYVKDNYPQLSNEEVKEFLLDVSSRLLYLMLKIKDICTEDKK